jgi:hypothetical protein
MRRVLAAAAVLALVVPGCGTDAPAPRAGSGGAGALPKLPKVPAPRTQPITAAVQDRLANGRVGLSDLAGRAAIEPSTVRFASDARLTGVRWTRWDAGGATGHGTMRVLTCNPNCAAGGERRVAATIELSRPTVCPDGRFFSASKVRPDAGPVPASYLRAPC